MSIRRSRSSARAVLGGVLAGLLIAGVVSPEARGQQPPGVAPLMTAEAAPPGAVPGQPPAAAPPAGSTRSRSA